MARTGCTLLSGLIAGEIIDAIDRGGKEAGGVAYDLIVCGCVVHGLGHEIRRNEALLIPVGHQLDIVPEAIHGYAVLNLIVLIDPAAQRIVIAIGCNAEGTAQRGVAIGCDPEGMGRNHSSPGTS